MSYLTRCNYCVLRSIKEDAKKSGHHIVMVQHGSGHDIFTVRRIPGEDIGQGTWRAWLMEISKECVCG